MKATSYPRQRNSIRRLPILLGLATLTPLLSACYVAVAEPLHEVEISGTREEIYALEAPPPPQSEVIVGVAPSPAYLWVGGYWTRHRDGWFWVRGRWAVRPHHEAIWVGGHWDRHPRGYVWVGGRWR
jgi:hypothetical protein